MAPSHDFASNTRGLPLGNPPPPPPPPRPPLADIAHARGCNRTALHKHLLSADVVICSLQRLIYLLGPPEVLASLSTLLKPVQLPDEMSALRSCACKAHRCFRCFGKDSKCVVSNTVMHAYKTEMQFQAIRALMLNLTRGFYRI